MDMSKHKQHVEREGMSRREFLKFGGGVLTGIAIGCTTIAKYGDEIAGFIDEIRNPKPIEKDEDWKSEIFDKREYASIHEFVYKSTGDKNIWPYLQRMSVYNRHNDIKLEEVTHGDTFYRPKKFR